MNKWCFKPYLKILLAFALISANPGIPDAMATPPGSVPFGFFKAVISYFSAVGGYLVASNAYVTGASFATGTGDGMLGSSHGIAYDAVNDALYVTDGSRVLKFVASSGAVVGAIGNTTASIGSCPSSGAATGWCTGGTFAAGAGDGMFSAPYGLSYDSTHDALYIADRSNNRIVKVTASTGAFVGAIGNVTASTGTCPASGAATSWCTGGTFASGNGDGMLSAPWSIAYDSAHDLLFISDGSNARIVKMTASTGAFIGAVGKTTSSSGTCPASGAATVWCTGGVFATGTGNGMYNNVAGLSFDSTHDALFISDTSNFRIVKITASTGAFVGAIGKTSSSTGTCPSSGATSSWCTGGVFATGGGDGMYAAPYGLSYDSTNDALYIADRSNSRVVKVTASSGVFVGAIGKTTSSTGTCPSSGATSGWCTGGVFGGGFGGEAALPFAADVAYDSAHNSIYVVCNLAIYRINKFTATSGVFAGADGGRVRTMTGWGQAGVQAAGAIDGAFNWSTLAGGIAYDSAHNYLFTVDTNGRVQKFVASTGAFVGAIGLTSASTGTCPSSGATSGWCTGGTFITGTVDGAFSSSPRGLVYDADHDALYIVDSGNNRVVKVTASTGVFVGAIGKTNATTGTCPASGAASGWCTGGNFTTGTGNGMFYDPMGIDYDSTHNALYITDRSNYRVVKVTASTGAFVGAIGKTSSSTGTCPASGVASTWCTGGVFVTGTVDGSFTAANSVAYDSVNDAIYIADSYKIVKATASTGAFVGSIGSTSSSTGTCPSSGVTSSWCQGGFFSVGVGDGMYSGPSGLVFNSAGNALYIADTGNNRIVKVTASTGAFVGAIGKSTASTGTCPASGSASSWCTGGTFSSGSGVGMFNTPTFVSYDSTNNALYISDCSNNRIVKKTPP